MSQEIICRECRTRNTLGSKFCNNCGARLPAATKLICPSCETPNPSNRFYCDNCGTRLAMDELPKEEPKPDEPPAGTGKIFSLPIRPPGDTGELDAKQSIPDWLKGQTDSTHGDEVVDEDSLRKLPKIEDVGDAKKMTDDLPDWLIDEHESNPILGSPRIITTEHYQNLIDETEDAIQEEIKGSDEPTNLPDWLNDLATPTPGETTTTTDDQSTTDDALAEWLASISQSEDGFDSEADDEPAEVIPPIEDLEQKLDELSQSDSGLLEPFDAPEDNAEGDTDWLSTMRSPDTDLLAGPESQEPAEEIEDEIFDWLSDSLSETGQLAETGIDAIQPETDDSISDSEPDWLTTGNLDAATDDTLGDLADAVAEQEIGSPDDVLSDWLVDEDIAPTDPISPEEEVHPDWMDEFTASDPSELEQASEQDASLSESPSDDQLPDWLADFDENDTLIAENIGDETILTDLFASNEVDEAGLDWLEEEGVGEGETAVAPDDTPSALIGGDTDWLSELVSLGDDAFTDQEDTSAEAVEGEPEPLPTAEMQPDPETDLFAADWPTEMAAQADGEGDGEEAPEGQSSDKDSEWLHQDSLLANALEEEMPDWLDELGDPQSDSPPPEPDDSLGTGDSLPDWIAQMKPGSVHSGSHASDSSDLADLSGSLLDIPDDLAGHELPNWLQDSTDATDERLPSGLPLEESVDIPEWLSSDEGHVSEDGLETDSEWTTLLHDLPPASAAQDQLTEAEVPDWIQKLKPPELTGEKAVEEEKLVQDTGPLSGIRGVIDIEPIIAQPRGYEARPSFTITPNQQTHTTLLKQLSLVEQAADEPATAVSSESPIWARLVLAVLLLAVVLTGLLRPNTLPFAQPATHPSVELAFEAVQNAAQQPVLLAVEYTPAMAGELQVQAEMLAAQLLANGSEVVTMSQYAAGTAVIQTLTPNQATLGLIPGESVGLRQLSDCLPECAALNGRNLTHEMQQTMADISLIIVLTGERDSLVNWLEQVGSRHDIPIVASVTQSLEPVAAPYFNSGQIHGVIAGMPDTAVYEQLLLSKTSDSVVSYLSAQTLAQLLAAVVLLVGGLGYIIAGLFKQGRSNPS